MGRTLSRKVFPKNKVTGLARVAKPGKISAHNEPPQTRGLLARWAFGCGVQKVLNVHLRASQGTEFIALAGGVTHSASATGITTGLMVLVTPSDPLVLPGLLSSLNPQIIWSSDHFLRIRPFADSVWSSPLAGNDSGFWTCERGPFSGPLLLSVIQPRAGSSNYSKFSPSPRIPGPLGQACSRILVPGLARPPERRDPRTWALWARSSLPQQTGQLQGGRMRPGGPGISGLDPVGSASR